MRIRNSALSVSPSFIEKVQETIHSFSASGRVLFYFFSGILVISTCALLFMLNASLLVKVPAHGGSYAEGIIGAPRFINPILAVSDADRDITSLVFSGLLKATPEGQYIPDLAESFTISSDGKTYTFTLRKNALFQDTRPVTADDVVFTITKTQTLTIKSPVRANWNGVVVQKIDDRTVSFTLKQAYAPFIENLTIGILPKHLWENVADDEFSFSNLNTSPIGSGPFKLASLSRTSAGIPSSYTLVSYNRYALRAPYLSTLTFYFYQNEDALIEALKKGEVHAASSISPARIPELQNFIVSSAPLNRIFGVFFNQNQSEVLRDNAVRQALNDAIDRKELVRQVLGGFGTPLVGPLPPSVLLNTTNEDVFSGNNDIATEAKNSLIKAGWQPGPNGILQKSFGTGKNAKVEVLAITLSTGNVPELRAAAEFVRRSWSAVGASVNVQVYDQGDLAQNVIRPRKYDALLFGEVIGRVPDLFAFWSSGERLDPGLNISLYANSSIDKIVSQLRTVSDESEKKPLYQQFTKAVLADHPAVFLYAPDFVYIVPKDIKGLNLGFIETPNDRFLSITNWHRETDRVWSLFAK